MWTCPGPTVIEPPVVFIFRIIRWVDQAPVGVGAGDRHFHAAKGIHNAAKAVKVDHGGVVNANAEVVCDGIF